MSAIARRAELVKLGRVLGVTPAELETITPDDVDTLRTLRDGMSAARRRRARNQRSRPRVPRRSA